MLDRIENARRLKERLELTARRLRAKADYGHADRLDRVARSLGWEIENLTAAQSLAAFAAGVEE
jgi:hypothetical protein